MSELNVHTILFLLDDKDSDVTKEYLEKSFEGLFEMKLGKLFVSKSYNILISDGFEFMEIEIDKDVKYHRLDIYFSDDVDAKGYRFVDGNTGAETDMSQTLGGKEIGFLPFLILMGLDEYISSLILP